MASKASFIVFALLIAHSYAQVSLNNLIDSKKISSSPCNGGSLYRSCGVEKSCVPRRSCPCGAVSTTCRQSELCCDIPNKTTMPDIDPEARKLNTVCGWRNTEGIGPKITAGNDTTQFGEFPWMVAILRKNYGGKLFHLYECGGSFIAPNVVLTAAHCLKNRVASELIVRGGEWDTQTTNEILNHVDKQVQEIVIHENYKRGNLHNDIALLILEEPFDWQENIRPICLPEPDANFDYTRCYATGWGKDKFGREGRYQVILKKIDLPVIPRDTCQTQLRKTRLGRYFILDKSFLCAGGEKDKDTCKGDGGSPLVCPVPGVKDRYYQAGIIAWGIGCNEENVPGVYANVPYLRPWISGKLAARGISFDHFTP